VSISTGIRQGESLSPVIFNLIMYEIIKDVQKAGHGYRTNTGEITILCYADDAVIISENEDELLYQFYLTAKCYNMSDKITSCSKRT